MAWMAWTPQTAAFFIMIGSAIMVMTVWELVKPTTMRKGMLPVATTRGDRFFISLLAAAFMHLTGLGIGIEPLWLVSILAIVVAVGLMRWG